MNIQNSGPKFGAQADMAQAVAIKSLAHRLYGKEVASEVTDELSFAYKIQGLGDFNNAVKEVKRDNELLVSELKARKDRGLLPEDQPVSTFYLWEFPSLALAYLGKMLARFFVARHPEGYEVGELQQDRNRVLLRWEIRPEDLDKL